MNKLSNYRFRYKILQKFLKVKLPLFGGYLLCTRHLKYIISDIFHHPIYGHDYPRTNMFRIFQLTLCFWAHHSHLQSDNNDMNILAIFCLESLVFMPFFFFSSKNSFCNLSHLSKWQLHSSISFGPNLWRQLYWSLFSLFRSQFIKLSCYISFHSTTIIFPPSCPYWCVSSHPCFACQDDGSPLK